MNSLLKLWLLFVIIAVSMHSLNASSSSSDDEDNDGGMDMNGDGDNNNGNTTPSPTEADNGGDAEFNPEGADCGFDGGACCDGAIPCDPDSAVELNCETRTIGGVETFICAQSDPAGVNPNALLDGEVSDGTALQTKGVLNGDGGSDAAVFNICIGVVFGVFVSGVVAALWYYCKYGGSQKQGHIAVGDMDEEEEEEDEVSVDIEEHETVHIVRA